MKYYAIAEMVITNRSWISTYVKNVAPMVERYGGRYLARTTHIDKLEGNRERPQVFLIIEWPSKEAAESFYQSDEYKPYLESRKKGARNEFVLVAGEDINGTAQMAD